MNALQQREHKSRMDVLERDLAKVIADVVDRLNYQQGILDEQRAYIDHQDQLLRKHVEVGERALEDQMVPARLLVKRGFWGRVSWLLTGR